MPRFMTAFVVALPLLVACNLFSPKDTHLWADAPHYTLTPTSSGYGGQATLSFSNANSFAVIIPGCGAWGAWLERRRATDGVWEHAAWLGSYLKCGGETNVGPGATVHEVVPLALSDPSLAGAYRVTMDVRINGGLEPFTSNTFTLLTRAP